VSFRGKQRKESRLNPSRNQAKDNSSYPSKGPRFFFAAIFSEILPTQKMTKSFSTKFLLPLLVYLGLFVLNLGKRITKKRVGNLESFDTQTSQ